jgi:hypothetical protein
VVDPTGWNAVGTFVVQDRLERRDDLGISSASMLGLYL